MYFKVRVNICQISTSPYNKNNNNKNNNNDSNNNNSNNNNK